MALLSKLHYTACIVATNLLMQYIMYAMDVTYLMYGQQGSQKVTVIPLKLVNMFTVFISSLRSFSEALQVACHGMCERFTAMIRKYYIRLIMTRTM